MRSLREFANYQEVFKTPELTPPFFEQNLVDPNRVLKVFQDDPQGHIRIFYYQYLKFCFQVNHPKSEEMVQKIEELINNPTFQFIFYQEDDPSIFNDNQAKAFTSEFFGQLSSGEYTVLDAINAFPIMDIIMVHLFRTLMILMQKIESLDNFIPRDDILGFLCPFFGIEVQLHDNCIKYVDTDVFAYDLDQQTVYMAYINYTEVNQNNQRVPEQPQINSQQLIQNYQEEVEPPSQYIQDNKPQSKPASKPSSDRMGANKGSYIASQFFDYTTDHQPNKLTQKATALKVSDHAIQPAPKFEAQAKRADESAQLTQNLLSNQNAMKYVQTASVSSGSEQKIVQESHFQNNLTQNYGQTDYLSKSNPPVKPQMSVPYPTPSQIPSNNQLPPMNGPKYQSEIAPTPTIAHQPIPTKDYSDASIVNQYKPPSSTYEAPKPMVDTVSKPVSSYQSNISKDMFYNPKIEAPLYNPKPEIPLYNTSPPIPVAKGMVNEPKNVGYQLKTTTNQYTSSTVPMGKKKGVFGLNVSDEFTSPQTIKSMAEPYKTNVETIKTRARQYRNSLAQFIK